MFCVKCGNQVGETDVFCYNCGTRITDTSFKKNQAQNRGLRLILLKCEACGATELKEMKKGHFLCEYCGSRYITDDNNEVIDYELTEKELVDILREAAQYEIRNEYYKELQCFLKVIDKAPDNISILLKLGRSYRRNNMYDKALTCYNKVLELEPLNTMGYANIGSLYCICGQYSEAEKYLKKAIQMAGENPTQYSKDFGTTFANYAFALGKLGRIEEAKIWLSKAEEYGYDNVAQLRKILGIKKRWFT